MAARDIVVIGASAGGVEAVQLVASGLPSDLNAAVFVTIHQYAGGPGFLPQVLSRAGPLSAVHAEDGMGVEKGRIYVAPPDYHLVIQNGFLQLSHGPKENLQRPCINAMFRSAATAYGERVAGVLLTGLLDDGAAGLWEIQQHNGATIVQDPDEAAFRSMPDSAIRGLNVQYIVRLREIPPLLARLSMDIHPQKPKDSADVRTEPAGQVCPECGGVMTKAQMGRLLEFRCHTGHRFGLETLISQKSALVERTLISALAQSEELVNLLRSRAEFLPAEKRMALEAEIDRRLDEQNVVRQLMENGRDASQAI